MQIYVSMPDYTHKSGGVVAMHYLTFILAELGHDVYTNASEFGPYAHKRVHTMPYCGGVDMIVLPEGYQSISLNTPILRWVLYYPQPSQEYRKNEHCYVWIEDYRSAAVSISANKDMGTLRIPILRKDDLSVEKSTRDIDCFWVYKGVNQMDNSHPADAVEITHSYPDTKEELRKLLSRTRTLYSYDQHTSLTQEAYILGCNVMVRSNGEWVNYTPQEVQFQDPSIDKAVVQSVLTDFISKANFELRG